MESYELKFNEYIQNIDNDHILFEVTKLCNYSCFYPFHKSCTIHEVYDIISKLFQRPILELYFVNNLTKTKISLPFASSLRILEFIHRLNENSNQVVPPIYPLPCKIVYRLFCDDNHSHGDHLCQPIVS